ncbi:MAG TPA: fibronectin type III domain-containing protein [Frankiaceae bacterium]|jgi:titin|nr:fibronectin type III domain-containing protein [Frankiaceae bacterium]
MLAGGLAVGLAVPAAAVDPLDTAGDATPPEASAAVAAPVDVSVADGPAYVVVTARAQDAASGVASVQVRLGDSEPVALSPITGGPHDGQWSGIASVRRGSAAGLVTAYVDARDVAGNATTYSQHVARVADAVPGAPPAVAAAPRDGALDVTWEAPAPNGGSPVASYTVTAVPVVAEPVPVVATAGADDRAAALTGLTEGVRYLVTVAAANAAGTGAPARTDALVGTPSPTSPSAPLALVATPLDAAADVTWAAPERGAAVTGYEVVAPGVPAVRVAADVTSVRLAALKNGTAYAVTVTALSDLGAGLPATVLVRPRTRPAPPVITGTLAGDRQVRVSWNAPASDGGAPVHAYVLTAHPTGARYVVPGTARGATPGGLDNGKALTFTVVAANAAGDSAASAPSAVTTPRQPVRLTVLTRPGTAVTYGAGSHATARLTSVAGTPIAGRRVELEAQVKPSTTWRVVSAGVTDSTGFVRVSTALPATAGLRLRHPADALAGANAWLATVYVAPRVTARGAAVRAGQVLTVTGTIAPSHPAGSRVTLQRHTGTGWVNLADGRMTTTTAYAVSWRPRTSATYPLRVVKHADGDHTSGVSPTWRQYVAPEPVAEIARQIEANARIALDRVHTSGRVDGATAYHNVVDLADGLRSLRSSYEGAPGGRTAVDPRLLKALRRMGERGRVTVSEITGGSHSRGSTHYYGRGLDIRAVNGVPVARGTAYGLALDACRAFGASRIFHPGYDPYGGHQGHVHCDWD